MTDRANTHHETNPFTVRTVTKNTTSIHTVRYQYRCTISDYYSKFIFMWQSVGAQRSEIHSQEQNTMNRSESYEYITEEEESTIHSEAYEEITVGSSCSTIESFGESQTPSITTSVDLNRYSTHSMHPSMTTDPSYSSSSFDHDLTFDGEEIHSDPVDRNKEPNQTEINDIDSFILCVTPQRRVSTLSLTALLDDSLRVELS